MGTIIHAAAIVTSWSVEHVAAARNYAGTVFADAVSGLVPSPVNGHWSFLIASSGSKLGWGPEAEHRVKLREFHKHAKEASWHLDIVFVQYGEMDEGPNASEVAP